jgi:hypothetical protein
MDRAGLAIDQAHALEPPRRRRNAELLRLGVVCIAKGEQALLGAVPVLARGLGKAQQMAGLAV